MNYKYTFGSVVVAPLLPLMYLQGKKIRKQVPELPEAIEPKGVVNCGNKLLRVAAIGESTIAGVGVENHKNGFTAALSNHLAQEIHATVEWEVFAKSGYTAKKVKERIIPSMPETNYDLIVLGLGGNDAFTLNTPTKWRSDIRALVNSIQSKYQDTPMVFINMPPIHDFPAFTSLIRFTLGNLVEILGEELALEIASFKNVHYCGRKITLEDWQERLNFKADPSDFFSDGVHPSQLTYQTWGKDIANFIISNQIVT